MPKVINAGNPGDGTGVFLAKLPKMLELMQAPATAVVSMGANDCVNPKMQTPLKTALKNYRSALKIIADAGFSPVLLTLPPIDFEEFLRKYPEMQSEVDSGLPEKYLEFAEAFAEEAAKTTFPVVDLFHLFRAHDVLHEPAERLIRRKENCGAYDGIHPTPHGHFLIGALIWQTILMKKLPQNQILCLGDSLTHGYPLAGMGTVSGENYPSALAAIVKEIQG